MKHLTALSLAAASLCLPPSSTLAAAPTAKEKAGPPLVLAMTNIVPARVVTVGETKRSYLIHMPKGYNKDKAYPVVLVFHGGGSNAAQWITFCGMNETADRNGFVAIYPNGTGRKVEGHEVLGWNGGPRRPGGNNAASLKVDDVGFTRALLEDLGKVVKIDRKRVYAAGMSMGGIMAYRLASELSDQIAAMASVAGPMGTETCAPKRAVSVLHIHGTEDGAVPIAGGKGKLDTSGADYVSVDHTIEAWVKADGCNPSPVVEDLPDKADDGTRSVRRTFGGGRDGAEVALVTVKGGGHTWPGREFGPELSVLGKSSHDFSANEMMWEFFAKHPMK